MKGWKADGSEVKILKTEILRGVGKFLPVEAELTGFAEMILIATDAGDSNGDHSCWGDARLEVTN